jgi:ParB family chromosome partitioning protein
MSAHHSTTTGDTHADARTAEVDPEANACMPSEDAAAAGRPRLMIPVSDLAAHPGNVRADLNLTAEFLASVAAEGVRIPLLITPAPDGTGWRVIEGHRRLAAALKSGLAAVPCAIDPGRAGDEAGQYVDMLLANSDGYRTNYTVIEEAAALFAAHEAGATRTRLRKATGRTAAQVKTALAAGSLSTDTKARAAEMDRDLTLDDLALLAEFDSDPDATDQLLAAIDYGYPLEHAAERIRRDRAEAAEHARLRGELEASGITLTDALPNCAVWLTDLTHDGAGLTPDAHAACPGHGATFATWNLLEPRYYCADPTGHGHASRWSAGSLPGTSANGGTSTSGTTGAGQAGQAEE